MIRTQIELVRALVYGLSFPRALASGTFRSGVGEGEARYKCTWLFHFVFLANMDEALKVLSFPFSYLVNKGRDKAAQKFSGGDVTDLALRKVIIRDIEELKSRCSAEARKELLVSSSFLKEGLELLRHPFRNSQSGSEERAAFEEVREAHKMSGMEFNAIQFNFLFHTT